MKLRTLSCVTLVVLLVMGVAGTAMAEEPAQQPSGSAVHGRVEAKGDSWLTLSTPQGRVSISVDGKTRYCIAGVDSPTLADTQVGDTVLVLGKSEAANWVAWLVVVLPPRPIVGLRGEIQAIAGQTITLRTPRGEKEVLADGDTAFRVPDVEHPSLADIQVGQRIFALVEREDGDLLARIVAVVPEGARWPLSVRGRVTGVTADTLTLRLRRGELTVVVTEKTRIRVTAIENPTLADIRTGDWLLVVGRREGLFRFEAIALGVIPPMPVHRFALRGEVTSIEGTTLVVEDVRGPHTVLTDEETRFRVPDAEEPSLADVQVGDHVLVLGRPAEGEAILARWIAVRPPPETAPAEPEAEMGSMTVPES